ncbi:MAG: hypothetical protein VX528_16400, partial [Candidatus Latescibacterota bacterium]|nr:hypothetical protein [Candidatus Latescibacterota bacterium]
AFDAIIAWAGLCTAAAAWHVGALFARHFTSSEHIHSRGAGEPNVWAGRLWQVCFGSRLSCSVAFISILIEPGLMTLASILVYQWETWSRPNDTPIAFLLPVASAAGLLAQSVSEAGESAARRQQLRDREVENRGLSESIADRSTDRSRDVEGAALPPRRDRRIRRSRK